MKSLSAETAAALTLDTVQCGPEKTSYNFWSEDIAFGRMAPWTYNSGDQVVYNGVLYKANWGGQEVPGSRSCIDEAECKNKGIQWVGQGNCNTEVEPSPAAEEADQCGEGIAKWSSDIANGRIAPWTYNSGDQVVYEEAIYQANWGGQEIPGSRSCTDEADCKNKGIQWVKVKNCNGEVLPAPEEADICGEGKASWSEDIAFGRIAPWTYNSGDLVVYNGVLYKANWGGQEVPGSRSCIDEAECKNKGIQWVGQGNCNTEVEPSPEAEAEAETEEIDLCGEGIDQWLSDIANGITAPWTYNSGDNVRYNYAIWKANWGGQEVPGSKPCGDEADCKNKGIQWVKVNDCKAEEIKKECHNK